MTAPLLEMHGIVKQFPGVRALDGVDLQVLPGEVHCLLGQNGAGKSTLIKVISGLVAPDSTLISVDLPAPFWPSRQCTSPARTSKSTPCKAVTPGKCFTRPRTDSSGAVAGELTIESSKPKTAVPPENWSVEQSN